MHRMPLSQPLLLALLALVAVPGALRPLWAEDGSYGLPGGATSAMTGDEFQGSVVGARKAAGLLPLSLRRAIELGLANNLGLLLRKEGVNSARGQRWIELSKLLPNLATSGSFHHLQENLAITGISLPGVPSLVGPYHFYDGRIFLNQRLFDLEAIRRSQAAGHEVAAAELSEKDARELVVVAVGTAYLQALAGQARVETVKAQLTTANAILNQAVQLHQAGVTPGIDELRARVESLTRNQQLIVAQNDFEKQKLALVRTIGLPVDQKVVLTDQSPFQPLPFGSVADLLAQAYRYRDDYRAAQRLLKAAESSRQAAEAQRLPALVLDADYGLTGLKLSSLYGTYHIVGSIRVPIFEGGKIHGDVLRAEALEKQRREELADLRGEIEFEVRTALLDVTATSQEVEVALKNVELAELTLYQAQERFSSGITDNLEVVQAQQTVAAAHEALVSSQYRRNLALLLLARATGVAGAAAMGGM